MRANVPAPAALAAPASACGVDRAGGRNETFPLRVEDGRRYLVDASGRPFLVTGDTAWSLIAQLRTEDVDRYLDDRKTRGFNAVLVSLLESTYASKAPANIYGERPFLRARDFSTPNEAYFAHADKVIRKAADRDLLLFLTPAYFGYSNDGWYDALAANGPAKLEQYGRYLGQRYGACANIVWVIGGDRTPPDTRLGDAIARGITSAAATSMFTAHADGEASVPAIWGKSAWLGFNTLFTYKEVWPRAVELYKASPRPFVLIESAYENDGFNTQTPTRIRTQAYHALLGGAAGQFFGNNPLWHFDGPGCCSDNHFPTRWQEALALEGSRSMGVLAGVFANYPWHLLTPDIESRFVTDGVRSGHDRIAAAVASDATFAIVYIPTGRTMKVELDRLRGQAKAKWIDPVDGSQRDGDTVTAGPTLIETPGRNAGEGTDWLLVFEAAGGVAQPVSVK